MEPFETNAKVVRGGENECQRGWGWEWGGDKVGDVSRARRVLNVKPRNKTFSARVGHFIEVM